jgi:hypothetical protein
VSAFDAVDRSSSTSTRFGVHAAEVITSVPSAVTQSQGVSPCPTCISCLIRA